MDETYMVITVQFQRRFGDEVAAQRIQIRQKTTLGRHIFNAFAVVANILVGIYMYRQGHQPERGTGILFMFFGFSYAFGYYIDPFILALFTHRKGSKNYEITVDDTGLQMNGPLSNYETGNEAPWSWIRQVYENEQIFLILYTWNETFILPKRGFADDEVVDQFRALVKEQVALGLKVVA